jgi:hypothetical protein
MVTNVPGIVEKHESGVLINSTKQRFNYYASTEHTKLTCNTFTVEYELDFKANHTLKVMYKDKPLEILRKKSSGVKSYLVKIQLKAGV